MNLEGRIEATNFKRFFVSLRPVGLDTDWKEHPVLLDQQYTFPNKNKPKFVYITTEENKERIV